MVSGFKRFCHGGFLVLLGALSACGGGGSEDTGETPPSVQALDLAGLPAGIVSGVGFLYAATPMMWGQFAKDWSEQLHAAGGSNLTQACPLGGDLTLTLDDRDGSATLTQGDQIQVALNACEEYFFGGGLTGTLRVEQMNDPSAAVRNWKVNFPEGFLLGTTDDGATIRSSGALLVTWTSEVAKQTLLVTPDIGAELRYAFKSADGSSLLDVIRNASWRKTINFATNRYEVALQQDMVSETLGGGLLTLRTSSPLTGYLNHTPDTGLVVMSGAKGGTVRAGPDLGLASPGYVTADLKAAASPSTADNQSTDLWSDLPSALFWWAPLHTASYLSIPDIAPNAALELAVVAATSDLAPETISVNKGFHIQLSKAFQPSASFNAVLTPYESVAGDVDRTSWGSPSVPATVSWNGASIDIMPSAPLMHGWVYQVQFQVSGVAQVYLFDSSGQRLGVNDWRVQTSEDLLARVQVEGDGWLSAASSATLSGSTSTAPAGTSYLWQQISGPTVQIGQPNSVQTTLSVSSGSAGFGPAEFSLLLTNPAGLTERQNVTLQVVPNATAGIVIAMNQIQNDVVVGSLVRYDANPTVSVVSSGGTLQLMMDLRDGNGDGIGRWLHLTTTQTSLGNFEVSDGGATDASWFTFETEQTVKCITVGGTLSVLQYAVDGDGVLQSYAADFDFSCQNRPSVRGGVRYHSNLPLN